MSNENKKKDYTIFLLLVLTLFPLVNAVSLESGTIISNDCLGDSYTLQSNLVVDQLVINSTCAGDVNNLVAFYNPIGLHIKNTGTTVGEIQLYSLQNNMIVKNTDTGEKLFTSNGDLDEYGATLTADTTIQLYTDTPGGTTGGTSYSYYSTCYYILNNECKYEAIYDDACGYGYFTTLELCEASLETDTVEEPSIIEKAIAKIKDIISPDKTPDTTDEDKRDNSTIIIVGLLSALMIYFLFYSKKKNKRGLIYREWISNPTSLIGL